MSKRRPSVAWEFAKFLANDLQRWARLVERGADPIEALGGHECGPGCWHWEHMPEDKRAEILRLQALHPLPDEKTS
jgi:hypothetical protein